MLAWVPLRSLSVLAGQGQDFAAPWGWRGRSELVSDREAEPGNLPAWEI